MIMKKIGMKRVGYAVISKRVLCALTIILQFEWIVFIAYRASVTNKVVDMLLSAIAFVMAFYVVNSDMKPYFKLTWVFIILFLPIVGCPAYFMFGRAEMTKRKRQRFHEISGVYRKVRMQEKADEKKPLCETIAKQDRQLYRQTSYIANMAGYPVYENQKTHYYESGEAMLSQFLSDLRTAKEYIFMEYFIIEPGVMFDAILEILEEKVQQGVKVRVIYDDIGCIKTVPPKYDRYLRSKGIECACFNRFRPFLSVVMNNRDHRKITVIDGRIAYTGGLNLADEYINEKKRFGYWKDAGIRIEGDAAYSFATMFLEMWGFINKTHGEDELMGLINRSDRECEAAESHPDTTQDAQGYIQPYADSPYIKEPIAENVYLNIINNAKDYVYIFTPYLIIGSELQTALANAAKSGVDVRIVTPDIPDKKMTFLLTQSHYGSLLDAGVKIYQFTPGFIHSKCILADDAYAVVGTINFDFRSLYMHFECGVLLYRTASVLQLKEDMEKTFAVSRQMPTDFCRKRKLPVRLMQAALRLFAPVF